MYVLFYDCTHWQSVTWMHMATTTNSITTATRESCASGEYLHCSVPGHTLWCLWPYTPYTPYPPSVYTCRQWIVLAMSVSVCPWDVNACSFYTTADHVWHPVLHKQHLPPMEVPSVATYTILWLTNSVLIQFSLCFLFSSVVIATAGCLTYKVLGWLPRQP